MDAPKISNIFAIHPRGDTAVAQQYRLKLAQKLAQLGYKAPVSSGGEYNGFSDSQFAHLQMKKEDEAGQQ
jgi:hypothetical protein